MNTPCIQDEGLYSRVPDAGIRMTTFVESYYRVGGNLEVLREGLHLEPAPFYAAMAFYCANKEIFDSEYERTMAERERNLAEFLEKHPTSGAWAEFKGALRDVETDEEIHTLLEELS